MSDFETLINCGYFTAFADADAGMRSLKLEMREIVPANPASLGVPFDPSTTPGEYWSAHIERTSFLAREIVPRHGNEFFVVGHPYTNRDYSTWDSTKMVIERWEVSAPAGAPFSLRPASTQSIGTPVAHSILSVAVQGGVYKMPSLRSAPVVDRALVGVFQQEWVSAAADPDGRFIAILDRDAGILSRLDLIQSPAVITLMLDSSQAPALTTGEALMFARQAGNGVKASLWSAPMAATSCWKMPTMTGYFQHRSF